jgi:prophage maintenance system killer protein
VIVRLVNVPGNVPAVTVLDTADLVVIAGRVLGIGTDAALAQMDVTAARDALAEAALARAALAGASQSAAPFRDRAAAAEAGAGLVHALLRHRPFPRHCEQVAVAAGLQFLSLNGWRADLNPPAPAVVVVEALASGQLTPDAAAAWLSARLSPARRGLNPARPRLVPARRNADPAHHARPDLARRARRVPPATWGLVRRAVAIVLLAVAVGGASLLAAACSRGPDAPAAPSGRPPASTAPAQPGHSGNR